MKVDISENGRRAASSIAVVLFLLLLSSLTSANAYQVGETFRDCETCPEMVVLPAGEFMMGFPAGDRGQGDKEYPQRRVTIPKPFAVGKYEVTLGQYAEFVEETKHQTENCNFLRGKSWDDPGFAQTNDYPVVCVSWYDVSAYIDWLSTKTRHKYRLLTEAEWEYAARAGTTTAYHFGRTILPNQAQYARDGTAAVGSFPANVFGLHDMHGNVWEWVEDCWHFKYKDAPTDGSAWLGRCEGKRMARGGSWGTVNPDLIKSAYRYRYSENYREFTLGFRVAQTLTP